MKTHRSSEKDTNAQNAPLQAFSGNKSQSPPPLQLLEDPNASVLQREEDEELMMSVDPDAPSYSPSGSLGADGNVSLGGSRTMTSTVPGDDPYGDPLYSSSTGVSGNASFNVNNGHLGGGVTYSQTDEIQNADGSGTTRDTSSVGANGYVDLNSRGEIEGGGGTLTASRNGTSVNIGGGIVVSAEPPRARNGRWHVTWTRSVTGTLGGGHSANDRGVSGSVSVSDSTTGSRSFATEEEAQAFYTSGDWSEIDTADASSLGQGDQVSETSGGNLQFGANGKLMGVTIGGSITVGSNRSVQVTGLGDHRISVRVTDTAVLGGSGSLGAPGISMSGGVSSSSSEGYIVTFDLNNSAGQGAYQYLLTAGSLPRSGYTMVAETESEAWTETSGVSIAGASVTSSSTTTESVTTYESGRTVEERQGNESTNVTIPLIGSFSESDELTATDDSEAANRSYTVSNTVNASSTEDVNRELARSTGVHGNTPSSSLDNQSDRRWSVTSSFSHTQIERLVSQMRAGRFNYHSLIYQSGHGEDFLDEVRAAGSDWDRIDRALSDFVAETGDRGLELIRNTIGVQPTYNLELQGDPYMRGERGHSELATQIRGFERSLSQNNNLSSLGRRVGRVLGEQRERLTAISDPNRYPDLPHELRQREVRRSQREIETLEDLRTRALAAYRQQQAEEAAQEPEVEEVCEDTTSSTYNEEGGYCEAPEVEEPVRESVNIWANVEAGAQRTETKRGEAITAGNTARRHHWIQVYGAYCFSRSAIDTWGQSGIFSNDEHYDDYRIAQSHLDSANSAWGAAEAAWNDYQTRRSELEFSATTQSEVDSGLNSLLTRALQKYGAAQRSYMSASRYYQEIKDAHPEGRNNQFQAYTQGRSLPSDRRLR